MKHIAAIALLGMFILSCGPQDNINFVTDNIIPAPQSIVAGDGTFKVAGAGISVSDVNCYVPHQANLRIMQKVAERLGIAEEKMVVTVDHHGNTSAASVPLALDNAARHDRIHKGDIVLMQAVGAGMAWGSVLLKW